MKRINSSDVAVKINPRVAYLPDFFVQFYTLEPEFYIEKNQGDLIEVQGDYYFKLEWSELSGLTEGVLEYRGVNNVPDNDREDNSYQQYFQRTTPFYVDSNTIKTNWMVFTSESGDTLARIGGYITSVTIPDSVTTIGDSCFSMCGQLKKVNSNIVGECVIPDSVTIIDSSAFARCSGLTSVTIPDSVTTINNNAFNSCYGLERVTIGNGVTTINNNAFYTCSGLTSVTIGSGVTTIGNGAFYQCSGLTSIVFPDSLTSIGNSVFFSCPSLTSVTIGSGITSIGNTVFALSRHIEDLTVLATTPPTITSGTFTNSVVQNIYVPSESVELYQTANYWKSFKDKIFPIT